MTMREKLSKLLDRKPWMPKPTKDEIVGTAIGALHEDLARITAKEGK